MNKTLKVLLIIIACIFILGIIGGIIAFVVTGNTANADEYKLGNDTIKSIKSVVEKRDVVSVSIEVNNGTTTQRIEYKSDTVQDDLLEYIEYLRTEEEFLLIADMNLYIIPSTVELAKISSDEGEIIIMTIDYTSTGYVFTIQKGEGTLNTY